MILFRFLFKIVQIVFLFLLPFLILVRGSVYIHSHYISQPWIALLGGALMTILVLWIYFSVVYARVTGKMGKWKSFKKRGYLAAFFVLGFCAYGLIYLSGKNVKKAELRKEYLSLHPVLRMGVSTLILADQSLIITDASRQPEDYRKMGLPSKSRSLHYKQSNGYVHAVDIRTNGRSEFRNQLIAVTFRLMGFRALRHIGTDDHLHISLKSHDTPGAY